MQPEPARRAGRVFRRYSLATDAFERELEAFEMKTCGTPDAVLVTSRMTYWYHGAADAIKRCRARWPRVPIVLGGIYATLCADHARAHSGADIVFEGDALETFPTWLNERMPGGAKSVVSVSDDPETWPTPAFDLCHSRAALPLLTSLGCPFQCTYCASRRLAPCFRRRSADSVFREVRLHHKHWGAEDFVFYDDALLVDSAHFFEPFLDRVILSGLRVRFHTPNGLHYWLIDEGLADKMRRAGVETIRLSLETVDPERLTAWGRSGGVVEFRRSVEALRAAGFESAQIGVYIMAGVPGQTIDEVRRTIEAVRSTGAQPKLNEYSPIPGTAEWERAVERSGLEIVEEPLWQNNSLYYTRPESGLTREEFRVLQRLARGS